MNDRFVSLWTPTTLYASSLAELDRWRVENSTTLDEARKRFVQFVVLDCVGSVGGLRELLTFKGGNALRFIYGNPRSTINVSVNPVSVFPLMSRNAEVSR